jgi:hypothetical protein
MQTPPHEQSRSADLRAGSSARSKVDDGCDQQPRGRILLQCQCKTVPMCCRKSHRGPGTTRPEVKATILSTIKSHVQALAAVSHDKPHLQCHTAILLLIFQALRAIQHVPLLGMLLFNAMSSILLILLLPMGPTYLVPWYILWSTRHSPLLLR